MGTKCGFAMLVLALMAGCGNVTPAEENPGAAARARVGHPALDGAGGAGDQGTGGAAAPAGAGGSSAGGAGGGGSAGSGAGGAAGAAVPCSVAVLRTNCTSCHDLESAGVYADLDLLSPSVGSRLVGIPATTAAGSNGACAGAGMLLERGGLPAAGVLIDKINFRGCGAGMPYAGSLMSPSDRACLQAWADGLVAAAGP